jgi:RNA polymerase sigma-70 factor (ECF subfamily)
MPAVLRRRQLSRLADEDLMALVRKGDTHAFECVYDRHADVAFSLAMRITGARPRAEEVMQEAFVAAWRGAGRYDRARGSVRSWVLGIVHNRAIDAVRRDLVHSRRRASDEGMEERFAARERTEAQAARREETETVRAALAELPEDQRRVIELAYYGGYTHAEIAEVIGAPVGTVKGRMRLGLGKLRGALGSGEVPA